MSPQELTALTSLLTLLGRVGTWPFGLLIFLIFFGPWIMVIVFWRSDSRRNYSHEEHDREKIETILEQYRSDVSEIKRLYESNARLVSRSIEAFERLEKLYGEAISVIALNTQMQTHLVDTIKNNQFCPIARKAGAA